MLTTQVYIQVFRSFVEFSRSLVLRRCDKIYVTNLALSILLNRKSIPASHLYAIDFFCETYVAEQDLWACYVFILATVQTLKACL
jgi:hypothetical protein